MIEKRETAGKSSKSSGAIQPDGFLSISSLFVELTLRVGEASARLDRQSLCSANVRNSRLIGGLEGDGFVVRGSEEYFKIKPTSVRRHVIEGESSSVVQDGVACLIHPSVCGSEAAFRLPALKGFEGVVDDSAAVVPFKPEIVFIHSSVPDP